MVIMSVEFVQQLNKRIDGGYVPLATLRKEFGFSMTATFRWQQYGNEYLSAHDYDKEKTIAHVLRTESRERMPGALACIEFAIMYRRYQKNPHTSETKPRLLNLCLETSEPDIPVNSTPPVDLIAQFCAEEND